jgi:hypothetical protein
MGLFDAVASLFDPSSSFSAGDLVGGAFGDGSMATGVQPVSYFPTYQFDPNVFGTPSQDAGAQPVMASVPAVVGSTAVARAAAPILFAIAQKLGLKRMPSIAYAMSMIRKMAKYLSPAATAAAIGISMADLATLMAINARKKRRRINPANTKALRRSMSRLQSFDRLATRVRMQLSHVGGRSAHRRRSTPCGKCRKSPCRC